MISVMGMPLATRFTTNATVIRIPRIQARPPITCESKVIRSNPSIAPPRFSHCSLAFETSIQTRVLCHVLPAMHTMQLEQPNAGAHLLPKAGAQRTLEAVRCSALILLEAPSPADHRGL